MLHELAQDSKDVAERLTELRAELKEISIDSAAFADKFLTGPHAAVSWLANWPKSIEMFVDMLQVASY